ncbi:hypothetical protein BX600DRAFT_264062 [Xylariales sp. PMI_506]|nr:hypothetical protein BX600DRAFT_264062 [Xylariales sp. PMI_506]
MSLSIDTVFQVVEVVQKAIGIYERIKDAPETIRKLGRRMAGLEIILKNLELHLRSKSKTALARLCPKQTEELLQIIDDTHQVCKKVYALFAKWENKIGPLGFQFRDNPLAQYAAQAYFALGSSAKDLEDLAAEIEVHRRDINDYMGLMGVQGVQANQDSLEALKQEIQTLQALIKTQGAAAASSPQIQVLVETGAKVGKGDEKPNTSPKPRVRPRPSPSPSPPRRDFKVIFVDPYNIARSVCSEAIMQLYRGWTTQAGGDWRIKVIHSAGFFSKNQGDCGDVIQRLNFKYKSYSMAMSKGGQPPVQVAVDAVFDNKSFGELRPGKDALRRHMEARVSRGVRQDVFRTYDYILVFTGREHDNMIKLRAALVAAAAAAGAGGKDTVAPSGKGRVVHLGQYLARDGVPVEIVDPKKGEDGAHSRDQWNVKVAQLKIAIRGFLAKEMEWTPPPR